MNIIQNSLVLLMLCAAALPATASATTLINEHFKGVAYTMPDGSIKNYPDPRVWAFTFWPGIQWPDSYGDGTNWLGGNGECQDYLTPFTTKVRQTPVPVALRYDPFTIQSDGLHITASLLTPAQQAIYQIGGFRRFGSGMLLSRQSFTYAHIRMVAKLPSARGSWPALWLLPSSHQWPPEVDVFEGMVWGSHLKQIHIGVLVPQGEQGNSIEWVNLPSNPSQGFHEYGLDWTPATLTMLFDGKVIYTEPTPAAMQQSMYLITNLAVGGKWPFNELNILPIDSMTPERLSAGADFIQPDYPAEMIVKSISVTSP
jgi:hypothetical protein